MRKIVTLFVFCLSIISAFSQALYPVSNVEKAQNSTLIVEGRVVSQTSFWNASHTMIYTSNKIHLYKIFKGETSQTEIEVLTHGGTIGFQAVHASDLLELQTGDIGVFFCFPNQAGFMDPTTGRQIFDVYASAQGFFKYDLISGKASDPFITYNNITDQFYAELKTLSGRTFTVVDKSFSAQKKAQNPLLKTAIEITSLTPLTVNAGATSDPANNLLTIRGSGFGTPSSTAMVQFDDANNGFGGTPWNVISTSSEVVAWTDTAIRIRVPSRAGSGNVIVVNSSGLSYTSFDQLNVHYSILTQSFSGTVKQSNLVNANGLGGYNLYYSSNMTPEATATFNRALKTWEDVSGFNINDGGTISTASVSGDGNCVVMLDNAAANSGTPLSAGVLGVCYSFTGTCSISNDYRKTEFDIVIRSSYSTGTTSFAYGPCPPGSGSIDLETVLLHELGHGLNLGHINDPQLGSGNNNNPAKLMHYATTTQAKRTAPDLSAYQGSLYTCRTNTTLSTGSCFFGGSHLQTAVILDAKDACPTNFPATTTPAGTTVTFDLEHATSNKNEDPGPVGLQCNTSVTNITNNLYYAIRTGNGGNLEITVSDFQVVPASASTCSQPFARISIYQLNSCPGGNNFPTPISCLSFSGNGILPTVTGLLPNQTYLLYVDGRLSTKSVFKLTFNGAALPVKIEKFTGEVKPLFNELRWLIAEQVNVAKIQLQRSANGIEFSSVREYKNIVTGKEYLYEDYAVLSGNNYYRLATFNKDGSVEYSAVVLLKRTEKTRVNIYPNPAKDKVVINISSQIQMPRLQLRIYNQVGQLISAKNMSVMNGNNQFDINTQNFTSGVYRIILTDENNNTIANTAFQKL